MNRASMPARSIPGAEPLPQITPISAAVSFCKWHQIYSRGFCQVCMAEEHEAQQQWAAHASEEEAH